MEFKNIIKEKAVKDCLSLEEFLEKYRLKSRYKERDNLIWGLDYSLKIKNSHIKDLETLGYTSISKYESTTSKSEYYFN